MTGILSFPRRWLAASLLFLLAFWFYLHGAYPSVSVGDSGEFITCASILGLPHAPGFPVYVLLGKLSALLVPWANVGLRVNLLSVLCAAAAVAVLFGILRSHSMPAWVVLFSALLFMATPAHRVSAEASEVFALNILLGGGIFWAALAERWLLAAFLLGLGMGNHQILVFMAPSLAFLYIYQRPRSPAQLAQDAGALIAAAILGFSVYFFLYVRAGRHPFFNWDDPETWAALWRDITRADYGSLTLALGTPPARDWTNTGMQLWRFIQGWAHQVTWVGVAIGVVGGWFYFLEETKLAIAAFLAFLFCGPVFFLLGNLPFDAQSTGLLERFYILPTFFSMLLIAGGVSVATKRWRWLPWAFAVLPLFLAIKQAQAYPARRDFRAYAYGRNNLRTLPPTSVLFMDGGDDTFYTLGYLTQVEKRRPDVELHDRGGLVFANIYGEDFRSLSRSDKDLRRLQVERSLIGQGLDVYYSTMNEDIVPGLNFDQQGILYRAQVAIPPVALDDPRWACYDLRGVAPWNGKSSAASRDYRTRALVPFYAYQRSVEAARQKDWEDAYGFACAAQATGPDVVWLLPNLIYSAHHWAQENFQVGRWDLAHRWYRLILHTNPKDATAWSDLGAVEERQNHLEKAMICYQKAIEADPSFAAAHYNRAVGFWKMERWADVVQELHQVLALDPTNAAARAYLARAQDHLKASAK
jgi:tetratricopeptide (TPR) repeat protein